MFKNIGLLKFYIVSTYPGTKYEDTCISEIEFYYKGKKLDLKNVEENRVIYLSQMCECEIEEIIGVYDVKINEEFKNILKHWKSIGINVDNIKYVKGIEAWSDQEVARIYFDFPSNPPIKPFGWGNRITYGNIYLLGKEAMGEYIVVPSYFEGEEEIKIKIGEWKYDELRRLSIKICQGEWKLIQGWRDRWENVFLNSDLKVRETYGWK